jgi:hypothetical protein
MDQHKGTFRRWMILFMFVPVFYGFKVWVKAFGAKEIPLE